MKDSKREPLLEQLAQQYIEEDGRRLLDEAEKLEENASAPMPPLDNKVRRFRTDRRRGRYVAAFGAVAAGLLLLFLLPRLEVLSPQSEAPVFTEAAQPLGVQKTYTTPPEGPALAEGEAVLEDAVGGAALDTLALESPQRSVAAVPKDAAPQAPAAAAPVAAPPMEAAGAVHHQESFAYDAPDEVEEAEESAAQAPAILPLPFTLPADFTVDSVRQDEDETIYLLANAALDDVVLSVVDAATAPLSTGGLVEITGEAGETAHGLAGADVQFLTFEQDGLCYRLTCRHDMHTLLSLWRHIVSA